MIQTKDFEPAIDLINISSRILITTHRKPDGDACGCVLAVARALKLIGKDVETLLLSSIPAWYDFLFDGKPNILGDNKTLEEIAAGGFDLVIIVDTNSRAQLGDFADHLDKSDAKVLVIDHHVTSDHLGLVELLDETAAAAGVVVHELIQAAPWTITPEIAEPLFVAIATDTGWFRHGNTDARAMRAAADLIAAGANAPKIYRALYENFSARRFALMTATLANLQLHFDGRYADQHLSKSDFEATGADYSDTEDLINECRRIDTVEAAASFVETDDGRIRCSLRSDGVVDVRKIAQKFGGGGHTAAAGTYLPGTVADAKQAVLKEIDAQLSPENQ